MPRLLAVGHVTWDKFQGRDVLGGTATYGALTARRLGWDTAVLTAAGPEFEPDRDLPDVPVFVARSDATTRFRNEYLEDGSRRQSLLARAGELDFAVLPDEWRRPDALLLGPVCGEVPARAALAFEAGLVGATAQGWLREVDARGNVSPREWSDPRHDLEGVHALFFSEQDLPRAADRARDFLRLVPFVALTRGWEGLVLFTREAVQPVPTLPRPEVDPTGAGDVFAAAFLVGFHETGDALASAAFAACAASCAVEGLGTASLGDRAEVDRRVALRERMLEDGEWEE